MLTPLSSITRAATYQSFNLKVSAFSSSPVTLAFPKVLQHLAWLTDIFQLVVPIVLAIHILLDRSYHKSNQ